MLIAKCLTRLQKSRLCWEITVIVDIAALDALINLVTFVQEPKDLVFLLLHIRNHYCPLFYFSSLTIPCCVK